MTRPYCQSHKTPPTSPTPCGISTSSATASTKSSEHDALSASRRHRTRTDRSERCSLNALLVPPGPRPYTPRRLATEQHVHTSKLAPSLPPKDDKEMS